MMIIVIIVIFILLIGATFASAPLYLLIFRVYYRLVTDTEGHKDFAKTSPPYGGLGKDIYDVLIKEHLISVEIVADWCSLLGLKNKSGLLP